MKKTSMIVAFVLMVAMPMLAEHVSPDIARMVATSFLNNNGAKTAQLSDISKTAGFQNLYIFTAEQGFVVMSADDRVQPILGYSMTGSFKIKGMPDNVRDWLQDYDDAIQFAVDNIMRATTVTAKLWKKLAEGNAKAGRTVVIVAPMIQTTWDQTAPFNNLCPGGSVTGCVATAMAQLMNYWEHPVRGTGSHSYSHSTYGQQMAIFSNAFYDWDNMKNSYSNDYTEAEATAVATLMYHCGVAVDMDYGVNGSSAISQYVPNRMISYFRYSSSMSMLNKSSYTNAQWISMLKNELNNNRPLYYSGRSSSSGHAFICDGYDDNNAFHFNWGWGGYCDGYYTIGALNPGSGGTGSGSGQFNLENAAIFGCQPVNPSVNPPSITATVNGRDANITWNSVSNASFYKVYRDGDLIASNLTSTSYTDNNLSYGDHSYYVKSVKSDGTMSLKSNTVIANVHFEGPVPTNLSASSNGNNVHLTWTAPSSESAILQYGTTTSSSSVGFNGSAAMYWAQRYPVSTLDTYAGMAIDKVSIYLQYTGSYTLYIYSGNELGTTELLYETPYTATSTGWKDINISNPVALDYTNDLWVVMYAPAEIVYPAAYCSYSGNGVENAAYYSTSGSGWNQWGSNQYSWLMKTYITDGTYTYNLYRNGVAVATNLNGNSYNDNNLTNGTYDYYVSTNYFCGESDPSNNVSVQIGVPSAQTFNLVAGWNWWSANVDITLDDLKTALVAALPGTEISIKSQNGNTSYNGSLWRGTLFTLDVTRMYQIHVTANCEITLTGTPINPAEHPVSIQTGANWIAFPLTESMSIEEVFSGFAVNGDAIKGQNGNAIFIGDSWRGSFTNLNPSKGYIYKSNETGGRTLSYPTNTKR